MNCVQEILNKIEPVDCTFKAFLCLEQPETIDFLEYLEISERKNSDELPAVIFNSEAEDESKKIKKVKKFMFDGIYDRTDKIKHSFSNTVRNIAENALNGQSQSVLIYGTEEKSKDKLYPIDYIRIFGESQNPGIFLCVLSELFELCHEKALQDFVTIKLSCPIFKNANFIDIFASNCSIDFSRDLFQGGIFHTVPQIIIRNVKTALKLLNLILKQTMDMREQDFTENLIVTLKLELDCKKGKDETEIYCLSKINFIKLANPSINSSLKGVNKNNVWFINFLNFLQSPNNGANKLEENTIQDYLMPNGSSTIDNLDKFTLFMKQIVFKGCSNIYGFISITNKMSSNQCLTALLFSSHLKSYSFKSYKKFINLPELNSSLRIQQQKILQILKPETLKPEILKPEILKPEILKPEKNKKISLLLLQYLVLIEKYMKKFNYLEYQYSLVIGEACEKLNKYIFTEQLQDFFYAKKINIEIDNDLIEAHQDLKGIRYTLAMLRKKILVGFEDEGEIDRLLEMYFSMAHHFLLDDCDCENLRSKIMEMENMEGEIEKENNKNLINVGKSSSSSFSITLDPSKSLDQYKSKTMYIESEENGKRGKKVDGINENSYASIKGAQKSAHASLNVVNGGGMINSNGGMINNNTINNHNKKLVRKTIDNLECMFKNKNVGIKNSKA